MELQNALKLDPVFPKRITTRASYIFTRVNLSPPRRNFAPSWKFGRTIHDHLPLGLCGFGAGAASRSCRAIPKSCGVKPDYEPAQFELVARLLQQGDAAGAVQRLEIATTLTPDDDAAFFQLSQAYRKAGRLPEAGKALAKYQQLIEANRLKKRKSLEIDRP